MKTNDDAAIDFATQMLRFRANANSYLFELTQEQIERAFASPHPVEDSVDGR